MTMEKGIQYVRELAVLEVIYGDLDDQRSSKDPDVAERTQPMWQKFVRSAPSTRGNSLAVMSWKDGKAPKVAEVNDRLRDNSANLSSSFISAVEKLSWEFQHFKEDMSYSPPVRTSISAIGSKRPFAQATRYI